MTIAELKKLIPITDVLDHYGWVDDLGWSNGWSAWQKTLCCFHDDHNPSAAVNLEEDRFNCFTCGIGGDIVDLVVQEESVPTTEAIKLLTEWFL